ncbi:hypothetical protein [Engelhardtia mirabilis]|uniref:Cytochrome c domain-containing protein n=1 Tax=Engelhardtia mirabilis TaxID=2528011 RepID=A0A518BGP8_9BACT|nr:hypothetical protein Pla133_12230 [Planctomycetes bacterium Pla133]QDV00484.1 hypothetical protein Pla86_12230 [Planctomycetes bacterium Pla86]
MKSALSCLLLCSALPPLLALRPAEPDGADECERIGAALGLELVEFAPMEPASEARLAQVDRATGTTSTGEVRLFRARLAPPADSTSLVIACQPLEGLAPAATAILALDQERAFAGAAVVDASTQPIEAWASFAANLRFARLPRLSDARPRTELATIRQRCEGDDSDDARLTVALLDLLACMHEQASVFNIPADTNPLTLKERAEMLADRYGRVAELATPVAALLDDGAARFVELALDSRSTAAMVADAGGLMDRDARRALFGNCKACHELPLGDESLKRRFARERERLGIGDGYFQVGHDLRVSHADSEAAQRVADAMRRAALLLNPAP